MHRDLIAGASGDDFPTAPLARDSPGITHREGRPVVDHSATAYICSRDLEPVVSWGLGQGLGWHHVAGEASPLTCGQSPDPVSRADWEAQVETAVRQVFGRRPRPLLEHSADGAARGSGR